MRPIAPAAAVLLALTLSGCTAAATPAATAPPAAAAEPGADLGNDRPVVSYDGLMVRRRVAVAIQPTDTADVSSLRTELESVAAGEHWALSDISPSALDPAVLDRIVPELTLLLPAGATRAEGASLIDPAGGRVFPDIEQYYVAKVLVHDLEFTVPSAEPEALADAIAQEGVLADALGRYDAVSGVGELHIRYTGPLLSDDLLDMVRSGIARPAAIAPGAVSVSPRSSTGVGVDMATEPAPAPVSVETTMDHGDSASDVVGDHPARTDWWLPYGVGVTVLFLATLLMVLTRRSGRRER